MPRALLPLVLFVLLSPLAAAQVPTGSASLAIALKAGAPDFGALASNASASVPLTATVTMSNVVCPQGGTMSVTFTVQAKTPTSFLSVAAAPPTVNLPVPGPAYVASPFTADAKSSADANTTLILTNVSVPVEVIASVAGLPAGCSGPGTAGAAASTPVLIYANLTAPPSAALPEPAPPSKLLPGPALPLVLVAIVAALRGRKR